MGGRTAISRNFERQPTLGSPHRSRHEGAEARTDVWGDAAGTAPAVTSVTRLGLRYRLRFPGTSQIRFNSAPFGRATCFWLLSRRIARTGQQHFSFKTNIRSQTDSRDPERAPARRRRAWNTRAG